MGMNTKDTPQTKFKRNQILILVVILIVLAISVGVMLIQVSGSNIYENITLVENRQVNVDEAFQFYQEEVYFLDVRTPMEWQAGHIPGATLMPHWLALIKLWRLIPIMHWHINSGEIYITGC